MIANSDNEKHRYPIGEKTLLPPLTDQTPIPCPLGTAESGDKFAAILERHLYRPGKAHPSRNASDDLKLEDQILAVTDSELELMQSLLSAVINGYKIDRLLTEAAFGLQEKVEALLEEVTHG